MPNIKIYNYTFIIIGCQFHMAKSMWNKTVDLGFKGKYSKTEFVKLASFVRAAIGLPYVPLEDIEKGFNHLKKLAKELKGKDQSKFGREFIAYVKNTWMEGNYAPETWNYYNHRGRCHYK